MSEDREPATPTAPPETLDQGERPRRVMGPQEQPHAATPQSQTQGSYRLGSWPEAPGPGLDTVDPPKTAKQGAQPLAPKPEEPGTGEGLEERLKALEAEVSRHARLFEALPVHIPVH